MKLYFNPRSRATVTKWLLDEAGATYETELVDFEKKEHKAAPFLAINPAGKLPALVDGDEKLFENVAIALYIAEKFPAAKLAPAVGAAERGRYLSLMVFATSQLEPALGDLLLKAETSPSRGWNDYDTTRDVVEKELGDKPYLLEQGFSAADVVIGSMFIWKKRFGGPPETAKIEAYTERLLARPHAAAVRS